LTAKQLGPDGQSQYAVFLPAISGFYATFVGKQRDPTNGPYVDPARMPAGIQDMEQMNWLNDQKGLFPYRWSLYSGGHANLDLNKQDGSEDMVRNRDPNTLMLGDSGGFQIAKGLWEGDWKANSGCPKAQKKREAVLKWQDGLATYGLTLDIPTWTSKWPGSSEKTGIRNYQDAVDATIYNNDYFIANRRGIDNGGAKFLNVLQGRTHTQSDDWYEEMKKYCDPNIYPDNHFNGWALGGQNKIDVELMLTRLVGIIHDGLLQEGKHDLIHCLGVSIMEYAVVFTDIQRAIRKYHNPNLQITFDCASPFFSAAKGLAYFNNSIEHNKKWAYSMEKTAENKDYANDNRKFSDAVLQDGIHKVFADSPVTDRMVMKDLCYRGQGFIGQHGKETKTSWDTLSYTLLQAHNVYQHIVAVQEANRQYEQGLMPKMVMNKFDDNHLGVVIDEIFSLKDRQKSLDLIKQHSKLWTQMQSGSQGFSGKKTVNAMTMFDQLFDVQAEPEYDEVIEDSDDIMAEIVE
jgi:hypothetical protein